MCIHVGMTWKDPGMERVKNQTVIKSVKEHRILIIERKCFYRKRDISSTFLARLYNYILAILDNPLHYLDFLHNILLFICVDQGG